jgi:hypothetical protein
MFPSSERQVRVLGPIVEPTTRPSWLADTALAFRTLNWHPQRLELCIVLETAWNRMHVAGLDQRIPFGPVCIMNIIYIIG